MLSRLLLSFKTLPLAVLGLCIGLVILGLVGPLAPPPPCPFLWSNPVPLDVPSIGSFVAFGLCGVLGDFPAEVGGAGSGGGEDGEGGEGGEEGDQC